MKLHIVSVALACTLLLAGCAAGEGSVVSSPAAPSVSSAEPAAAPEPTAEPTPEPTPTPAPDPASLLEYTMLPLNMTQDDATACQLDTLHIPDNPEAEDYARQFAWGLYHRDADAVRAACSDRALSGSFPLNDLDELCITEFSLGGGEYETPFLTLTVADPGSTPLLRGQQSYYLSYDSDGKVDWLSPYGPGATSDYKLQVARYDQTVADDALQPGEDCTFIAIAAGDAADTLGLVPAAANLECYDNYWLLNDDGEGNYEARNQQTLGAVDAPPYGITRYGVPPDGNVLTDNKLEVVCEDLNQFFAALADGSYTDEFYATPGNAALLSAWDAAVPLPAAVTPDVLRTITSKDAWGNPITTVWVPLPENCWAVVRVNSESSSENAIDDLLGFTYYQSVPTSLAAVLPQ